MNVTVLLNRGAAGAAGDGPGPAAIAAALREHGVEARMIEVGGAGGESIAAAARRAAAGADAVVAAGGDGTVSAVAGALAGGETPLAVLPLGTFNNFAGDLGIPNGLAEAAAVVAGGRRRRLDLAQVNGLSMLNNSTLGIYADAVRRRSRAASRLSKGLRTAAALLPHLRRPQGLSLELTGDGFAHHRRTPLVFVGNNEYEINLFSFGARPRISDGRLFVYLVRGDRRATVLRLLLRYLLADAGADPAVERFTSGELRIDCARRQLDVFVDGEVHQLEPPLIYRALPGALTVLAPAG